MKRDHRCPVPRRLAAALPAIAGLAAALAPALPARAQSAADQWASAIREQQDAIATNRTARARCGTAADPRCAALNDRARLMEENLGRLQRQHSRLTGVPVAAPRAASGATVAGARIGVDGRRVREVAPPGVAEVRPVAPAPQRSLFSMLFGGGGETQARSGVTIDGEPMGELRQDGAGPASGDGYGAWSGNYRTLCVRTCDGFYFPVSFNSSRGRLKTDAAVCKALCPQAETRLYYHDANGQEAEDAVAADDGTALAKMTNAFVYRTKVIDGCTCGTPDPRSLPVQAGGLAGLREARMVDPTALPLPRRRPDPDQDPATQSVQISGLSTEPVAPLSPISAESEARIAAATAAEPPKIRVVGPKFFSDR